MQSRAELYKFLDYHSYERSCDELFEKGRIRSRQRLNPSVRLMLSGGPHGGNTIHLRVPGLQTKKVRGSLRRARRQHRALHRRPSGNDLHYRGYDIPNSPHTASLKRSHYLLLYGELPNAHELAAYKQRLARLRGLPQGVKRALEQLPPHAHPMDVLRTGVSVLATRRARSRIRTRPDARAIADTLLAWPRSVPCCSTGTTLHQRQAHRR